MTRKLLFILFTLLPIALPVAAESYIQERDLLQRDDPITSLVTALRPFPQASDFSSFITLNPEALTSLLPNDTTGGVTLLVPSNTAFSTYQTKYGVSLASISQDQVRTVLQYHVLVAPLNSTDFKQATNGLTVPTFLTDQQYNNRSAGPALLAEFGKNANGQVLYFSKDPISSSSKVRVRVRQSQSGDTTNVRAGVSEVTTLDVIDGKWEGGTFQIVNDVLVPPAPCSNTIRPHAELSALDTALNRSGLYPTLDHAPNVTCLAPNTKAFAAAGDPQNSLAQEALSTALLFHTLPMPLYTNFLVDGQELTSLANLTVKISVNSSGTYFNDARVLEQNVLTNNGVIHVLDRVMTPLNQSASGSPTSTSSASQTSNTATTTAKGAASGLLCNRNLLGLLALISIVVLA